MYRSQGSMGEFFAYSPPMSGMGEYFAGTGGALVDWARQEEAEAGHAGIFGLGEYFAQNGMGEYSDPKDRAGAAAFIAGIGAVCGLAVGGLMESRHRLKYAGIGAVVGVAGGWLYGLV